MRLELHLSVSLGRGDLPEPEPADQHVAGATVEAASDIGPPLGFTPPH